MAERGHRNDEQSARDEEPGEHRCQAWQTALDHPCREPFAPAEQRCDGIRDPFTGGRLFEPPAEVGGDAEQAPEDDFESDGCGPGWVALVFPEIGFDLCAAVVPGRLG